MANGKPGDHPIGDFYLHGLRIFPSDICELLDELKRRAEDAGVDTRLELAWDEELRSGWDWSQPNAEKSQEQLRQLLKARLD